MKPSVHAEVFRGFQALEMIEQWCSKSVMSHLLTYDFPHFKKKILTLDTFPDATQLGFRRWNQTLNLLVTNFIKTSSEKVFSRKMTSYIFM